MKLLNGKVVRGEWVAGQGTHVASRHTAGLMKAGSTVTLFVREQGDRATNGAIFVFSVPPQGIELTQGNNVAVTQTRHGYTVGEGGLEPLMIRLDGNFGWKVRKARLPKGLMPVGLKRTVQYDHELSDFMVRLPKVGVGEEGSESMLESLVQGRLTVFGVKQVLDGREAWQALFDLCHFYVEENVSRVSRGKTPLELVFHYPLEELRWVVVPRDLPSLRRRWESQGTWPYSLQLVGVYDDSQPQPEAPDDPWELEPVHVPRTTPGRGPGSEGVSQ